MKKTGIAVLAGAMFIVGGIIFSGAVLGADQPGEALFKQHCAVCHENGGNIMNAKKTLHKKEREASGVKTAADIVKLMRTPGAGMTKFDEKTISDKDAKKIAEYILKKY